MAVFRGEGNTLVAKSLLTLLDQVNAAFPGRNDVNDGTIGDDNHAQTESDHNATAKNGPFDVITALDITHDPAHGFDADQFAEVLRLNRDPRIKYVIRNGRIFSSTQSPWIWRARNKGPGDHTEHVHISVGRGGDGHTTNPELYDDTAPWSIRALPGTIPTAAPSTPGARRFTNIKATVFNDTRLAYGPKVPDFMGYSLPGHITGELPLRITNRATGLSAIANKCDVGPWYDGRAGWPEDRWWENGTRPRAETDSRTNGAGIDLYPALARAIGVEIIERNGRIVAGEAQVDVEIISETQPMAETSNTDALLRQLIEQVTALARVVNVVMGVKEPPADPPKADPVVTVPTSPPPGPVAATVQSTSMQLSTIAGMAIWALQAFGVLPPGVGEAATQLGAVLSAAPIGSAAVSATGGWGLIQTLFNRITGRKS